MPRRSVSNLRQRKLTEAAGWAYRFVYAHPLLFPDSLGLQQRLLTTHGQDRACCLGDNFVSDRAANACCCGEVSSGTAHTENDHINVVPCRDAQDCICGRAPLYDASWIRSGPRTKGNHIPKSLVCGVYLSWLRILNRVHQDELRVMFLCQRDRVGSSRQRFRTEIRRVKNAIQLCCGSVAYS